MRRPILIGVLTLLAASPALAAAHRSAAPNPAPAANQVNGALAAALVSKPVPITNFFAASLPGAADADRKIVLQRGSVPASTPLRVIVRSLDAANPAPKMIEFPAGSPSVTVVVDVNTFCGAGAVLDVSGPPIKGVNVERKHLYSIEVYNKADVPDNVGTFGPPTTLATKAGGMVAARPAGLRPWNPATPDHSESWPAWTLAHGPTCMPGAEPWPEPEPMGAIF